MSLSITSSTLPTAVSVKSTSSAPPAKSGAEPRFVSVINPVTIRTTASR